MNVAKSYIFLIFQAYNKKKIDKGEIMFIELKFYLSFLVLAFIFYIEEKNLYL